MSEQRKTGRSAPLVHAPRADRRRVLLTAATMPPMGTTALHYGDLRPPMGLGFIASFLERHGHEVRICDNYLAPLPMESEIEEFRPDIIGLYMHSPGYYSACDLIDELKQIAPEVPLVAGGPHASLLPHNVPAGVDYVCTGEGEHVMLDLAEGWRPAERIIDNAKTQRIKELDDYPFPNYDHFVDKPYNWGFDIYGRPESPVFTMHTSRSCPYRCTFCGVAAIWTRKWTAFSADRIVEEIDAYVERYGCQGVYFREDLFTTDLRRVERMCDLLIERPYDVVWACESRADITSERVLEKMARSGCIGLYCGIESGSTSGLKKKKKDLTPETMRTFFTLARKVGINVYATFCMGTPTETEEELAETEAFVAEVEPFAVDRFAFLALPRSEDSEYIERNQLFYHKDSAGIIYTDRFREMAQRLYAPDDQRLYFLEQQRVFLEENRGRLSAAELAAHRFSPMPSELVDAASSSTHNEFRLNL
jgi:radical SAM superfamily enzyme YgiQ (UPF0313 family)